MKNIAIPVWGRNWQLAHVYYLWKINHTDVDILSSQIKTPFSDHPTPPSQKEMGYLNQTIVIIPFSEVDPFFFLLQKKLPSSAF